MPVQELTTVAATTFVVSDSLGDIAPGEPQGIFAADTRFLSGYRLRLAGIEPLLLRSGPAGFAETHVYATNAEGPTLPPHSIELVRRRRLAPDGVLETIEVTNRRLSAVEIPLMLFFAADFADIFEVRAISQAVLPRRASRHVEGDELVFYDRLRGSERATRIRFSQRPNRLHRSRAYFRTELEPRQSWTLEVRVEWTIPQPRTTRPVPLREARIEQPVVEWLEGVPTPQTNDPDLHRIYQRAVRDLATLEIALDSGYPIPAAGLPWFLAIFGRDAIITSLQTLTLGPRIARGTLYTLAAYQSTEDDAFRDEEPGKMPHEIRFGELAASGLTPHARYYGTVDATPLWIVLLGEYVRATGDRTLVDELLPVAERALTWIERYGDLDGDGLIEYERRSPRGLANQGWKDSWDAIRFADGRLAEPPIALIEAQGYVYAAKQSLADLYEAVGRIDEARPLREQAARLRQLVREAFWLPGEEYFALALDGRKRQVDAICSNPGHLLWSGLVDERDARRIAARLLAPDLFSGWGIRTLSAEMLAYSPISYHNGSVWPHDNSLIAAGLRRYGLFDEARTVIESMLEAARHFDYLRLPELFCGHDRATTPFPVNYPVACSPQAWAAGSIVLMLTTLGALHVPLAKPEEPR